ncbi:hypothetical protein GCM10007301_43220 [Azorhizobium oxalatiphilum]|uniref:Uncharacterized protein n=1 Tax=Azorhizobium oxalatiphilum TaxID=980631 RepID=A0A917C8W6_9HYPH|nr:hypothetical protein [Azorhizobium oxalatiphilum]GGF78596.1 hypothetical protein GCM10007301_43220 [Azorhizobium oxalatiphilum]
MPFHTIPVIGELPASSRRVELCYNHAKTVVWLQLTNTDYITGGLGQRFVTALIGGVTSPAGWSAINPATADRYRDVTLSFGDKIGNSTDLCQFQRAICVDWKGFSSSTAGRYAKGLTFGRDMSGPSFVMKALKTGFDAIGATVSAYNGVRARGFTVDDAVAYLQKRAQAVPPAIVDPALTEFIQVGPDPAGVFTEDRPMSTKEGDRRNIGIVYSNKNLTHNGQFTYMAETAGLPLKRVIAYGFRGDSRPPSVIRSAGGFNSNYTRPDHIAQAQTMGKPDNRALDLPTFLGNQHFGGYISVCKSYAVTKGFATNMNSTTGAASRHAGWIYACFVEGGFDIPPRGVIPASNTHPDIIIPYDEQEISMPGLLDWRDTVACRQVDMRGAFEGNIFIKEEFMLQDPDACMQIYFLLSGISQGLQP